MIDTFRILILADLSGGGSREMEPGADLISRRRWQVDRDTFDEVLAAIAPMVRVPVPGGGAVELAFRSLDDFRPEALVERIPAARALHDLRARLLDPARFAAAREEARSLLDRVVAEPATPSPALRPAGGDATLIEDLLAGAERQRTERARGWRAQVLAAIAPEVAAASVPGKSSEQRAWVEAVDAALAGILRAVLHEPPFQALEAAWRGVLLIARRLDTSEDLTLSLLDVSGQELADGALAALAERDGGGPRWSLLVADATFEATTGSAAALRTLAEAARAAGTALVAGAAPGAYGCPSVAVAADVRAWAPPSEAAGVAAWNALRASPAATAVAVASPRILLRLPYGAATDPVDGLSFEELGDGFRSATLLWGNAAFLVACALGTGFARDPGDPVGSAEPELDELPSFVRQGDGERVFQPPGEAAIGPDTAARMAEHGVIAVVCGPHDTSIRLRDLFPLAGPGHRLVGPWAE